MTRFAWAFAAAVVLLGVEARGDFVVGTFEGTVSGNDNETNLEALLGVPVKFLAKVETVNDELNPNPTMTDGLTVEALDFNMDGEATMGKWSYDGSLGDADIMVVKAGHNFAVYSFATPNMGLWDTSALGNKGMSHISVYTAVPEPSAFLYGGLVAVVAGCGYRFKRRLPVG